MNDLDVALGNKLVRDLLVLDVREQVALIESIMDFMKAVDAKELALIITRARVLVDFKNSRVDFVCSDPHGYQNAYLSYEPEYADKIRQYPDLDKFNQSLESAEYLRSLVSITFTPNFDSNVRQVLKDNYPIYEQMCIEDEKKEIEDSIAPSQKPGNVRKV